MVHMTRSNEKGIALVFTLFLMATLSALAVSLMFLAQTETSSTRNYRTMSQARYAGEAGVHKAINHLLNSYTIPGAFTSYNMNVSPVTCTSGCTHTAASSCDPTTSATASTSGCVVLSGLTGVSSNYPDATVATAFNTAAQGTLATNAQGTITNAALGTVTYGAAAILMSMRQVNVYGGGTGVIQTWQIVADGTVPGSLPATVEVTAMLERQYVDAQTFAVFATGTGCGAISLNGTVSTDSYDSSVGPATTTSGGNVGTNGNMTIVGHVGVNGTLSSPNTGVGACVNGSGVDALTETGAATVCDNVPVGSCVGSVVKLPQAITFPPPCLPTACVPSSPMPPMTTMSSGATICAAVTPPAQCATVSGVTTIDPMGTTVSLGNVSGVTLVLKGGSYNINSVGSSNLSVATSTLGTKDVVLNVTGKTSTPGTDLANPISLGGNAVVNASLDPSRLQILYAGTGSIDMTGGSQAAATVYAPNASFSAHGNADFYGSILVNTMSNAGNPSFHYDRHMQNTFFTMGNYVMSSFSWKKY
jgi:Tfp pilus assembly protein PilX